MPLASLLALAVLAQAPPPNVVFILIDDLGWRDLGCAGSSFYETPNIDRLADSGMRFTAAYSNGPNCAPSRACLMSGQYPPRHGVYTVGSSARGKRELRRLVPIENTTTLRDDCVTIAEVLQQRGYTTAHFGKWHLGRDPKTQGFDVNVGGNTTGSPRGGHFAPYRNPQLEQGPDGEYLTDRLTDEVLAFLRGHRHRPFFVHLSHYAVHTPIQSKREKTAKYRDKRPSNGHDNANYAGMIDSVDDSVGRVLDELDALKLTARTIVWFFSDNGGHGPVTSMQPLRGAKGMLYEGGIRVPMIVRWPDRVAAGSTCAAPVIGTDIYPTLLALTGSTAPEDYPLDGVDLSSLLLEGEAPAPRDLFWHFPAYLQAGRNLGRPFRTRPAGAIRCGRYKLLEFFEDGRLELYDLEADLGETTDLAAKHPDRVRDLHARLEAWREALDAPVPTEPNPDFRGDR